MQYLSPRLITYKTVVSTPNINKTLYQASNKTSNHKEGSCIHQESHECHIRHIIAIVYIVRLLCSVNTGVNINSASYLRRLNPQEDNECCWQYNGIYTTAKMTIVIFFLFYCYNIDCGYSFGPHHLIYVNKK